MALIAPSTSLPSSQILTTMAKQQDEACTTTVWTSTWPAPNHDTYSTYQTLVPCEGGLPAMLRPQESTTPLSQPARHHNQVRDSTPNGGTLTGIVVAIAGLLLLGITMCIILKRKPNESRNLHHAGGTRTARGSNGERQWHRDPVFQQHDGRRRTSAREPGFIPAVMAHSTSRELGTMRTQSALVVPAQINRDRLRLALSDQAPAAGSSTFPVHAAQDSMEDAESTARERAAEDGEDGKTPGTPEEANEEGLDEE